MTNKSARHVGGSKFLGRYSQTETHALQREYVAHRDKKTTEKESDASPVNKMGSKSVKGLALEGRTPVAMFIGAREQRNITAY